MKAICFYFQIHQPFRLKNYRFFDIGNDHYYYDDFANDEIITRIAQRSYLPANAMLLDMIKQYGKKFKVAFSISGTALEQLEVYVPEFIESMKELADTGCVEFLSETYAHSLSSLEDPDEFVAQVKDHDKKIYQLFGQHPKVFRNTELIYDDDISAMVQSMGFKGVITEGAKHILGWKSPNYVYASPVAPKLKLLLKNSKLSDDISFRFSNPQWASYPLTADKYIDWIAALPEEEQLVNLFMNYETFGVCQDRRIKQDWYYLQASDHFFYMSTKHNDDGNVHSHYSPYDSPYTAFTNYMNVLSDFMIRVEEQYPESIDNEELNALLLTIRNQSNEISQLNREVEMLRNNIVKDTTDDFPVDEPVKEVKKPAKKTAKKITKKPAKK